MDHDPRHYPMPDDKLRNRKAAKHQTRLVDDIFFDGDVRYMYCVNNWWYPERCTLQEWIEFASGAIILATGDYDKGLMDILTRMARPHPRD